MTTTMVLVINKLRKSHCSVTLRVTELSERKLDFHISNFADLKNESGERHKEGTVRYFCGEGLSHVRRRLGLASGMFVEIRELTGTIREGAEVGISLAIAIAIAKALGTDDFQALLENPNEWEVSMTPPRT
jgi:hypothetical protein